MTTLFTPALIERCHNGSKAKGFWEPVPPFGQQLMLIVTELAEAVEAHRKDKHANVKGYMSEQKNLEEGGDFDTEYGKMRLIGEFQSCIKDTVEDELADAFIRIGDFVGGFGIPIESLSEVSDDLTSRLGEMPENFAECLLGMTTCVTTAYAAMCSKDPESVGHFLGAAAIYLEEMCKRDGINLAIHIDLKLQYNSTRPFKHSKPY
jgi:hypothetical protein